MDTARNRSGCEQASAAGARSSSSSGGTPRPPLVAAGHCDGEGSPWLRVAAHYAKLRHALEADPRKPSDVLRDWARQLPETGSFEALGSKEKACALLLFEARGQWCSEPRFAAWATRYPGLASQYPEASWWVAGFLVAIHERLSLRSAWLTLARIGSGGGGVRGTVLARLFEARFRERLEDALLQKQSHHAAAAPAVEFASDRDWRNTWLGTATVIVPSSSARARPRAARRRQDQPPGTQRVPAGRVAAVAGSPREASTWRAVAGFCLLTAILILRAMLRN